MAKSHTRGQRHDAAFHIKSGDSGAEKRAGRDFSGKAKGEGAFAIFATTIKYFLEPQFVEIKAKVDGKKSSFSVPGVIDVQVESFKNPVTGEEQDTKIQIPGGFIFKLADAAKTSVMKILTKNLNFDDSGKNAFVTVVEYKGP